VKKPIVFGRRDVDNLRKSSNIGGAKGTENGDTEHKCSLETKIYSKTSKKEMAKSKTEIERGGKGFRTGGESKKGKKLLVSRRGPLISSNIVRQTRVIQKPLLVKREDEPDDQRKENSGGGKTRKRE